MDKNHEVCTNKEKHSVGRKLLNFLGWIIRGKEAFLNSLLEYIHTVVTDAETRLTPRRSSNKPPRPGVFLPGV